MVSKSSPAKVKNSSSISAGKLKNAKSLALLCAKAAEDKLSQNVLVLNLSEIETSPADFFVICSCESDVQVEATAGYILEICREKGIKKPRIEGMEALQWVLMDFFDVVVHIMLPPVRAYYKLEKLWGDSKFMGVSEAGRLSLVKPNRLTEIFSEINL